MIKSDVNLFSALVSVDDGKKIQIDLIKDQDLQKICSKKLHDITGAIRTFQYALDNIKGGYKFDDDKAPSKIEAIEKAFNVIKRECAIIESIYKVIP